MTIDTNQLHSISDLLDVTDGSLRSGTIATRLADYMHTTCTDRPRLLRGASYATGLIRLNTHNLPSDQRKPLQRPSHPDRPLTKCRGRIHR
ncbi:hypothetical protein [Mycolicibacterium aubagnense]|uniref:Uncharacterized protein n=1 Tax=Mycolicibacterium aubagnense TaxID=319707 RepID=A0ABN5Z5F0_9MYCO|nr:hypothetical protein [Mycolicibacterium aubagnense]TLH48551.1 hypothetical protein C1S80_29870 [Mycolicibacterium aubagnense]BBX88264.1 hypothetical protein MAUB_64650 [Mycolicibacterium aubagnense]